MSFFHENAFIFSLLPIFLKNKGRFICLIRPQLKQLLKTIPHIPSIKASIQIRIARCYNANGDYMKNYLSTLMPSEKVYRFIFLILLELFAFFSLVYFIITKGDTSQILLSVFNIILSLCPLAFEIIFKAKFSFPIHLFLTIYIAALLLGHSYHFYDYLSWWDSMLHAFGGFTIALLGIYLIPYFNKGQDVSPAFKVIFAISFALGLSVLWEFFEYSCDHLIGSDMQKDTLITTIRSYFLGTKIGEIGTIESITKIAINGEEMPFNGYLDIGLIDTLTDLLMALIGSTVLSIYTLVADKRYPLITHIKKGG